MEWITEGYYWNQNIWWQATNFWIQFLLSILTLLVIFFSYRANRNSENAIKVSEKNLETANASLKLLEKAHMRQLYPSAALSLFVFNYWQGDNYEYSDLNFSIYNIGLVSFIPKNFFFKYTPCSQLSTSDEENFLLTLNQILLTVLPLTLKSGKIKQANTRLRIEKNGDDTFKIYFDYDTSFTFNDHFFDNNIVLIAEDFFGTRFESSAFSLRRFRHETIDEEFGDQSKYH